ncbi:phage portal protein [Micromonospora sp. WMMD1102]|uniref:phage portal protein n=1 Tax=Micromonospora sp. WMMD1102 TaxID=3016105 RepID=UPI00241519B1|nr:phage portal protein [Micromonospora sp. WMMD1102]MDG4790378.1 phage portal protein [Micromonospora sp. WMMD1102]
MGFWRAVGQFFGLPYAFSAEESEPRPIDRLIMEMAGMGAIPAVSRSEALSVPAVQKGRNLVCAVATLPLQQYAPDRRVVRSPLLDQLDPDVPNVVTLTQTIEDLLFDSISWWLVLETGWNDYPTKVRHLDVGTVSVDPPKGRSPAPLPSGYDPRTPGVWVDGTWTPASKIIRFDSPNPPVRKAGGRAIRKAILLDQAAAMYADDPRPLDYFTPAEGADPADDTKVEKFLTKWRAARKKRSTAYIPWALKYHSVDTPSPAELQLVELQKQAALEIANALGVDPEELGISTTSRTYANDVDRRRNKINDVLGPFMRAITDRLSMDDVTRPGYTVRFDLTDYLKPDPAGQVAYWRGLYDMDAIDSAEVRTLAGLSGPPPKPKVTPAPATDAATARSGADASVDTMVSFADDQGAAMTFAGMDFADGVEPPKVDVDKRTITGLAVPYNKIAKKYGMKFRFRPGSLRYVDVSRVKHLKDHHTPVGVTLSVQDTKRGPIVKLSVLSGPEGSAARLERDQLLYDAQEGLYDGLSIGVDFSLNPDDGDVEWNEKDQVYDVLRATWRETSSTPLPAFDDARVTKVAASRGNGDRSMPCTTCGQVHAEGVACTAPTNQPPANQQPEGLALNQDQITALLSRPGAIQALVAAQQPPRPDQPAPPSGALTLSAEQVDGLIKAGQLGALLGVPNLTPPAQPAPEQRAVVDPTRRTTVTVSEPAPYSFDRQGNLTKGAFDFSTDLIAGSKGDKTAWQRAEQFMRDQFEQQEAAAQFDVDKADAAALNPARPRPDLFVDQRSYRYPMWEAISKGTIADATPFVIPKFNSASGLVADHAEDTEPTPGTYTATSQTITPTPVSGKVEITRVAWDQGGNPQLSGLIWRQMQKAWYEALEAAAVAVLDAASPTAIALTAGGGTTGQTLDSEITAAFASLQFIRGGFSMDTGFAQIDLYKALVAAKDSQNRRLYPAIGPMNASGTTSSRYSAIDVNGVVMLPAWALAATGSVVASSYLFDRESVHGWATTPQQLEFQYRVAYVDLAIWGYKATAITDIAGVREITYDPVA